MSIFSKASKKDELVLVFNIGSSSVEGALFYTKGDGVPQIIFSISEPIIIEQKIDVHRFLLLTLKSLEIVISKIYKKGLGVPDHIFCILSSFWYISETRVISYKKNTLFTFTPKFADSLIHKEIDFFKKEYLKKYENTDSYFRFIDFKNMKTVLDGFETVEPLHKKIKELEITLFIAISEEQVCKKIEIAIFKHFSSVKIRFSSFTMASFSVVRDLYIHRENFLLINIGGEVTDISTIKHNTLRESVSFPFGINFMIRKVSNAMDCTIHEAKNFISLFKDGHARLSTEKLLASTINELKSKWLFDFQESLIHVSTGVYIPPFIYMTIDKNYAGFFTEIIKNEQSDHQHTIPKPESKIVFLDIKNLNNLISLNRNVSFDSLIAVDTIYINRLLSQ